MAGLGSSGMVRYCATKGQSTGGNINAQRSPSKVTVVNAVLRFSAGGTSLPKAREYFSPDLSSMVRDGLLVVSPMSASLNLRPIQANAERSPSRWMVSSMAGGLMMPCEPGANDHLFSPVRTRVRVLPFCCSVTCATSASVKFQMRRLRNCQPAANRLPSPNRLL